MKGLLLGAVASLCAGTLPAAVSFCEPCPVPGVRSLSHKADVEVRLDAAQTVTVTCPDAAAADWTRDHVKRWFLMAPKVVADRTMPAAWALGDEGYRLTAKPEGIALAAKTLAGVRHALQTLRQVAERDSSGYAVAAFRLPKLAIDDAPALAFRGLHLCWFPEMSVELVEREIRVAAALKYNVVVLESWGVFRSDAHPWFGWADGPMTKPVVRHLVEVSRDLGVTLVPQLNAWGHAAAARSCTGKHAALDFAPERQTLFEPGGGAGGSTSSAWNWCLTNPAALETVRELIVEMHEAFGNPPYFHIGCDEATGPCCASCRAVPYAQLVSDHIAAICALLKKRGARAMMWHDMLIRAGDARWKGFYANGSEETAKLPQLLPKDVIVCDWYYGNDPGGGMDPKKRKSETGRYPTLDYFAKECGFATLTCPWEEPSGIRAQAKYAREGGLFGVLETTWHHFGGTRFPQMVMTAACGAWGGDEKGMTNGRYATLWRQCGWDMGPEKGGYRETGWYDTQVTREILSR